MNIIRGMGAMGEASLDLMMLMCRIVAWPIGTLHYLLVASGILPPHPAIAASTARTSKALRDCWFTRCAQELFAAVLRTPLRGAAIRRVRFDPAVPYPGGCVFATIHSPWARLLAHWCRERHDELVLTRPGWIRHLRDAGVDVNFHDLRRMVSHLRHGHSLFAAIDVFPDKDGCPVRFFGKDREASLLPARLAAAGGVPMVAAIAAVRGGRIEFSFGPALRVHGPEGERRATQALIAYVEARIADEPAIWNDTLHSGIWRRVRVGGHHSDYPAQE